MKKLVLISLFGVSISLVSFALSAIAASPVFSIRTVNFDGSDSKTIYTDGNRQATHIRISPDGNWIMFSRYNERDPEDGLAKENWGGDNHYENTELMIMRTDGSDLRTLIPARKGIMAVNSNWTEDGRGFVFISTGNTPQNFPELRYATFTENMEVASITPIFLPNYLVPVDPHLHLGKLVFVGVDGRNNTRGLWIANADGSNARQLTFPRGSNGEILKHPESGDNDPRISPDGTQVAFMRLAKGAHLWNIYVVDIATGLEHNLSSQHISPSIAMDAVPEWSGDGKRLIFWSTNVKKITFDVVSMKPDGSDRVTLINNPKLFQQSPAFFPNTGSGPKARIAYSTQEVPAWKLKVARLLAGAKK